MNTETASPIESEKKPKPRWQLIDHPQGKEFQGIALILYALCGVAYILFDLTPTIIRGLIVATISLALYFVYSIRKK